MNKQYVVSIKAEVLSEAYADILARLLRKIKKDGLTLEDTTNVWVRMLLILREENSKILDVTSMEEAGVLEGMYYMARDLLDGEKQ